VIARPSWRRIVHLSPDTVERCWRHCACFMDFESTSLLYSDYLRAHRIGSVECHRSNEDNRSMHGEMHIRLDKILVPEEADAGHPTRLYETKDRNPEPTFTYKITVLHRTSTCRNISRPFFDHHCTIADLSSTLLRLLRCLPHTRLDERAESA